MSLILVATVGGVLLERFSSVARRTDAWGYAGAERGTRPATVRGPPTAVFSRPSCQIHEERFTAGPHRPRRAGGHCPSRPSTPTVMHTSRTGERTPPLAPVLVRRT